MDISNSHSIISQEGNTPINLAKTQNKQNCFEILQTDMVCFL